MRLAVKLGWLVTVVLVSAVAGGASGDPRTRYGSSRRRSSQTISYPDDGFERSNRMEGIPIHMAEALSKAKTLGDLERLVDSPSRLRYDVQSLARNAGGGQLAPRFAATAQDTSSGNRNGEMAVSAVCKPELTTVPIDQLTKKSNTIYWPSCTRIERCGGCCSHELLSCKPTASKTIHVQVVSMGYKGGSSRMGYVDTIMVPLEIHTACECGCKLTANDCNQFQEYVESECRCKCVNKDDYAKCTKNNQKLWEPSTCQCKCKHQRECSTGHYFDYNTCSCKRLPSREPRPFDPVQGNRFYSSFQNFYSGDNTPVNDAQEARHARPSVAPTSARPTVRVRGPQRSNRYDRRARRGQQLG